MEMTQKSFTLIQTVATAGVFSAISFWCLSFPPFSPFVLGFFILINSLHQVRFHVRQRVLPQRAWWLNRRSPSGKPLLRFSFSFLNRYLSSFFVVSLLDFLVCFRCQLNSFLLDFRFAQFCTKLTVRRYGRVFYYYRLVAFSCTIFIWHLSFYA